MNLTFNRFTRLGCAAGAAIAAALLHTGCATSHDSAPPAAPLMSEDTRAYVEMLRSDINTTKIRTYNKVMKLTPAEAEKFWPIYRNYEKELAAVGDHKVEIIRDFYALRNTGKLTDEASSQLAQRWLQNVQDRLDLWKKYNAEIAKEVSPIQAAQFLQVENQLSLFIDLAIASDMPLITQSAAPKK